MANPFTPEQISQILEEFFKVVGTRQYIGARYVPIFGRKGEESIEWDNSAPYEPLTIVLYQGNSYTSRQYVPVGVEITNQEFWAITGNYNAQVEQYRRDVQTFDGRISANATAINAETTRATEADKTNATAIANEVTRAKEAEQTNATAIANEVTRAKEAEQTNATAISNEATRAKNAEQTNATAISQEVTDRNNADSELESSLRKYAETLIGSIATSQPTFVNSTNEMTDHSKIYVLNTNGHIYTYSNDSFTDTGLTYTSSKNAIIKGSDNVTGTVNLDNLPVNTVETLFYATPEENPIPHSYKSSSIGQWIVLTLGTSSVKYQMAIASPGKSSYVLMRSYSGGSWSAWNDMHRYFISAYTTTGLTSFSDTNKLPVNGISMLIYSGGTVIEDSPFKDNKWPDGGRGILISTQNEGNGNGTQMIIMSDNVTGLQIYHRYWTGSFENVKGVAWSTFFAQRKATSTYTVDKSGSYDFTKVKDAVDYVMSNNIKDATICIRPGTYDIIEEWGGPSALDAMATETTGPSGMKLGNNIRIVGFPKTRLVANYTGNNAMVNSSFSVFNMLYGSNNATGFTLENLWIEGSGIRYIVHDDMFGNATPYRNHYKNCHFVKDATRDVIAKPFQQCIGGGFGISGNVRIENCYFKTIYPVTDDNPAGSNIQVVSYHNATGDSTDCISAWYMDGNYIDTDDNHTGSYDILAIGRNVNEKSMLYGTGNCVSHATTIPNDSSDVGALVWGDTVRN